MRARNFVCVSILLMFVLVACSSAQGAPVPTNVSTGQQTITVSLNNYGFKFSPATIKSGNVKFFVTNDSPVTIHELWIVKTNAAIDQLPLISDGTKIDEESKAFTKLGSVDDLDPGKTGEMVMTLDPGRYIYFCNQPGHYKLDMRGELNIAQ
jgi:uncharacterized cupredoxin-like copper-binding protein